jgi:hypothetical protein
VLSAPLISEQLTSGTETVHHARLVPSIAPPVPAVTTWPSTTISFAAIIRASFEERHEP